MRVLRLSLFVAATAIIAAACGDKINLPTGNTTTTTTTTAKINGVLVAPNAATISVLQQVQLTAVVDADAGITATVTWSTTSSAAATVSQTGLVTGVAASPGVAICATASATGVASKGNCATIVVQPATLVTPAIIQIASITTQIGGLNFPVPVPPAAVAGQINVSVNVSPGTERMDSVVVFVNNIPAAKQIFTSGQAAALRSAANDAAANQALQSTLVFSINTAAYATAGCATQIAPCGTVTFPNGPATISVVGYGHQGATAATNTVSQGVALLFGNADGWLLTQTVSGATTPGTVFSAAGFGFQTGSITMTAVPVAYTGLAINTTVLPVAQFGTAGCDLSGAAARAQPMTAPVAPSLAFTAAWTKTSSTKAGKVTDVNSYEYNVACGSNAGGGEGAAVVASTYANGGTGPVGTVFGSVVPVVRLDNRAPGAPTLMQNPNGRQNGWINAAVGMTGSNTGSAATANNWVVNGAADAGVGGYLRMVRIGAPGAGNIVDPVELLAGSNTPTLPAPSLTNLVYCGVFSATDALGNESALPAAGTVCTAPVVASNTALAAQHMLFGVDIAPPTIALSGGLAASKAGVGSTGASVGGEFQVAVSDTGIVGNSGMLATTPVIGTVTVRSAAAGLTPAQQCVVGTLVPAVTGVCTASSTGFALPVFPLVATGTVAAQTIIGYYTFSAQSVDAAGNVSTTVVSRVRSYNPAANIPALTGSLFSTPLTGPTATFTATGSSGNTTVNGPTTFFDLWKVSYNLAYAGGLAGPLVYAPTTIQTFNTVPFVNSSVPVTIAITGFVRQLENQTSACNAALAVGGAFKPNALNENLFDQVNNASGVITTPIAGGSVAAGVSYLAVAPATQQPFSFILSNGLKEQPTAGGCPQGNPAPTAVAVGNGGTSVDPTSVTLTADVFGPTATFNPPFAQVNFYVFVGGNMELIGSSTTFATTDDGSAQGRKHRYSLVWTPGTTSPILAAALPAGISSAACAGGGATNLQLYAVGVSSAGDALVSPLNSNVCLTNAP
jgi:hypothetical protein